MTIVIVPFSTNDDGNHPIANCDCEYSIYNIVQQQSQNLSPACIEYLIANQLIGILLLYTVHRFSILASVWLQLHAQLHSDHGLLGLPFLSLSSGSSPLSLLGGLVGGVRGILSLFRMSGGVLDVMVLLLSSGGTSSLRYPGNALSVAVPGDAS